MAQQFKVLFGASVEFNRKLFRGPCVLPNEVAGLMHEKIAGKSGMSCLEDAIKNGFVIPLNSVQHLDGDILNVGVRQSETPFHKGDTNKDPTMETPKNLLVGTSPGSPNPLPMSPAVAENVVSDGESFNAPGVPAAPVAPAPMPAPETVVENGEMLNTQTVDVPPTVQSEGEPISGEGASAADPDHAQITNGVAGSGWNLHDAQLEGRSLDLLNIMIVERLPTDEAPTFVAYETVEEARAHLQQDLVSETQVSE